MFACIFSRSVSTTSADDAPPVLVDLAFTFSPLVEQTTADTVVLDIAGRDLMFGLPATASELAGDAGIYSAHNLAIEIVRRARQLNLRVNVSVAANPDAAIHLARSFKATTIVKAGDELLHLGTLSLKKLDYSLAGIDAHRSAEIGETFALWGVRTFGDLAQLPREGVAERLGQEGVRLQKLAQGKSERPLSLIRPPVGFEQSLELEHPIEELEPLAFILSRLLNQLCANLLEHALATNEVHLLLVTEPGAIATGLNADVNTQERLHHRTITLPVPMRNAKNLLRLLLLDIEAHPPCAPIVTVTIKAEPVKPRAAQTGLFIPLALEPERLEITLARLSKLVGADNLGSPELLDTHRPDAFRMNKFRLNEKTRRNAKRSSRFALNAGGAPALPIIGLRVFRPPCLVDVRTMNGRPVRINARANSSGKVRGKIVCASGPWRTSGDWWRADVWGREEWDVAVSDPAAQENEVLCRIYRDLANEQWFIAGVYD